MGEGQEQSVIDALVCAARTYADVHEKYKKVRDSVTAPKTVRELLQVMKAVIDIEVLVDDSAEALHEACIALAEKQPS